MCTSAIGRVADPLNLTQGRGWDLAKPFGGWDTKLDPLNIVIPPEPETSQQATQNDNNNNQTAITPIPESPPYRVVNPGTGLQIAQP